MKIKLTPHQRLQKKIQKILMKPHTLTLFKYWEGYYLGYCHAKRMKPDENFLAAVGLLSWSYQVK